MEPGIHCLYVYFLLAVQGVHYHSKAEGSPPAPLVTRFAGNLEASRAAMKW